MVASVFVWGTRCVTKACMPSSELAHVPAQLQTPPCKGFEVAGCGYGSLVMSRDVT